MLPSTQPMIGRVERQHRLIEELRLRTAPLVSAELLADRLGVTTRTIERDIAELYEAGVPIERRRGEVRKWRVRPSAKRSPPPRMICWPTG